MKKFNGTAYSELRPKYGSGLKETRTILAKALPELPRPHPIANANADDTNTAELIKLDVVRKLDMPCKGKGFCAIVIDTGVFEHELLAGKIIASYSVNGDGHDTVDKHGHGTHMAGIIAADENKFTCMSVTPEAKIISIKVTKGKSGATSWANIYKALKLSLGLVQNPEKIPHGCRIGVINLSFNGLDSNITRKQHHSHKIAQMISALGEAGVPVVVSSGNGFEYLKQKGVGYPAYLPGVIPVGATYNYSFVNLPDESLAMYSQRFAPESPLPVLSFEKTKDRHQEIIYAPGVCSVSLSISNTVKYSSLSGTSVSAAIVSGCILLLQQKSLHNRGRTLSVQEVFLNLMNGSERFRNVAGQFVAGSNRNELSVYFDRNFYDGLNILNSLNALN